MEREKQGSMARGCRSRLWTGLLLAWIVAAAGFAAAPAECAEREVPSAVQTQGPEAVVDMVVSDYAFEPTLITAQVGSRLTLRVRNVSASKRNITIINPDGERIVSKDVPGNGHVVIDVDLTDFGEYEFYNSSPLEASLGMKGRIEVR